MGPLIRELSPCSYDSPAGHMSFTVKIHLTRSDKTVAELGDAQVAQQNQQARRRDGLLRLNDLSEKSTQAIVLGQLFHSR
jgi:hypothetical protein